MANEEHSERFEGTWNGQPVSIFRTFGDHRFTDEEVERLLAGEYIAFTAVSKAGNEYTAIGHIAQDGKWPKFVMDFDYKGPLFADPASNLPPKEWCGHKFSAEEIEMLKRGEGVTGTFTWKSGKSSDAEVKWLDEEGRGLKRIVPQFDN